MSQISCDLCRVKADISLLISCLDDKWSVKIPSYDCVFVCFSLSSCQQSLYIFQCSLIWYIYIKRHFVFLILCPTLLKCSIFFSCYFCYLEIFFVIYKHGYTCFSVDVICLENHFPPFHFESAFAFAAWMCLLKTSYG